MTTEQKSTAIVGKDVVEIIPLGSDQAIKLSVEIVRNLIAVPTRTGQLPSKNDALKFIALCKAKHLNPFEGDCFMLGYDTKNGPAFSQITAHQVFLKRAEANSQFDGMESGVVVEVEGVEIFREGDRIRASEKILGGWARVYRKDRSRPIYRELDIRVFHTGQSRWEKDPGGMIVKCAEADALRSAFPTHLGGLYTQGEAPIRADVELQPEPLVITAGNGQQEDDSNSDLQPQRQTQPARTPQQDLELAVQDAGFSFEDFRKVAGAMIENADSYGSFGDVPKKDAERLLRAKVGLLKQIQQAKGVAA